MSELLPGMNIRKMYLNSGYSSRDNRVPKGDTGMRVGCCVQDDHIELPFRLLNPAYQLPFNIRLSKLNFRPQLFTSLPHLRLDVAQCSLSIDFRLALAQQIQIWTIQKQDLHSGAAA